MLARGGARLARVLLERFVNGRARSNAYVYAPHGAAALIVDAGPGSAARIGELLAARELRPAALLLTHGHPDHIWAARELCEAFGMPAHIHRDDLSWFSDPATGGHLPLVRAAGRLYGRRRRLRPASLQTLEGPGLDAGPFAVEVLHTPGHTPGSVCFVVDGLCFAGDTVLPGGVGRTSYPGGNADALRGSIRDALLGLPDQMRVLPGHGRETTVAQERGVWEAFLR